MHRLFAALLAVLLALGCFSFALGEARTAIPAATPTPLPTPEPTPVPTPEPLIYEAPKQVKVTFVGDCTLGCTSSEREKSSGFESFIYRNGLTYPFEKVQEIFTNDDCTVINLESVFYDTDAGKVSKTYNFRAPMSFAEMLPLSSIEAASIANNHTGDYGSYGIRSTVLALQQQGVNYFGSTEDTDAVYVLEKDGVKIGFVAAYISYWWGHKQQIQECFDFLRERGCQVIVACIHGGVEYDTRHDMHQENMANAMIRYGADLVVGHHPHVLQGVRVNSGVTTLWSLGNFSFGGNSKVRSIHSVIAQVTFSFDNSNAYLGHQLNLIPAHMSGTAEYNNYQPVLVSGAEADQVIAAMQEDTLFPLQPYIEGVGAVQRFVPAMQK